MSTYELPACCCQFGALLLCEHNSGYCNGRHGMKRSTHFHLECFAQNPVPRQAQCSSQTGLPVCIKHTNDAWPYSTRRRPLQCDSRTGSS